MMEKLLGLGCALVMVGCSAGESGTLTVVSKSALRASQTQTNPGGGDVTVDRARIAASEIELEGGPDDDDTKDGKENESKEVEAELGRGVIEVNADGSPTEVVSDKVPAGRYDRVEIELQVGDKGGQAFSDFGGKDDASIIVEGTYKGTPFTYRSAIKPELTFTLDPAVDLAADGQANVAVTFDVPGWFVAEDGSTLDPNDAANHDAIDKSILASMAANADIEEGDDD